MKRYFLLFIGILTTSVIGFSQTSVSDSLLHLLVEEKDPNIRASYLLKVAKNEFEKSHDEYLNYSQKALAETKDPGFSNDTLEMKIINNVGCAYSEINDAQQANQHFFEAAKLAVKIDDQKYLSNLYNNIGLTFGNVNQYDKSIEFHLKSLAIKQERSDSLGVSISYTNVGAVYYSLGDYTEAKDYFEKSFLISKSIDDIEGVAFGYTNMADVYFIEGEYDMALDYYQKYLELVTELEYNHSVLYGHKKIGEINLRLGSLDEANFHISEAYKMATKFNYAWELTNICILFAELKREKGESNSALKYAKQALDHFPASASKRKLASIHQTLSDIYKDQGNLDLAYFHLKNNKVEQDSATSLEKIEAFAEMEAKYQLNLKDKENSFLKQEQLLNEKIISQRTIVALVSTLGLFFLLIFAYWLYKQKEIKNRHNLVLEEKVEERTRHLKSLIEQLAQANEEIEQFFYITSHDLKEPLRIIGSFSNLARRSLKKLEYDKASDYLKYAERSTLQLGTLFEGINEFFSISQQENKYWHSIDEIVKSAKSTMKNTTGNKTPKFTFHKTLKDPNTRFPIQIGIVLKNLFENGIRFNENTSPHIELIVTEKLDNFYISIKDDGLGIAEEYHQKVFEMFESLGSHEKHLGAGLGLAICKKIVRELEGGIEVKTSGATGTTFEFWINKKFCKIDSKEGKPRNNIDEGKLSNELVTVN